MIRNRNAVLWFAAFFVCLSFLVAACVPAAGPSAGLHVALSLPADTGIRASNLPFEETALHVLVIGETAVLPASVGSTERQRLADALSLRADPRDAPGDSSVYAERRVNVSGSSNELTLDGFLTGQPFLIVVIAYDVDDPDAEPYVASGTLTLQTGRNTIQLELERNHAATLNGFVNDYDIDPWSQEFAGLQLAVMDTYNDRALLLTGFREDGSGWNVIEPFADDIPLLDFVPEHVALADRGRLLLYGERRDDSAGTGFLLTNAEGRVIEWFGTDPVDMWLYNPIKVDRVRGYAYYVDLQSGFTQLDLSSGNTNHFDDVEPSLPLPEAFAVSGNGIIYLYPPESDSLVRFDPLRDSFWTEVNVDENLDLGNMFLPTDITSVGSTLYMFDFTAGDGNVVVGLDSSFNIRGSFGSMFSDIENIQDREFYGPLRFLESNSWNVYIADGYPGPIVGEEESRVVRFRGATGLDWLTYGEFGSGVGQFKFVEDGTVPGV